MEIRPDRWNEAQFLPGSGCIDTAIWRAMNDREEWRERVRDIRAASTIWWWWYGCTTWTLTKRLEKKLDGNYTRMLRAILNKSWRQHPTRRQLYGHLPPITKTIQVRRARHVGHCWRSKDELVRDVLQWTPTYGQAKAGRPARTYIQQLCEDSGCNPEDLPEVMNDREKWREMVKDIRAGGTSWWWWWWYLTLRWNPNKYSYLGQKGPGIHGNEELLQSAKISRCRILLLYIGRKAIDNNSCLPRKLKCCGWERDGGQLLLTPRCDIHIERLASFMEGLIQSRFSIIEILSLLANVSTQLSAYTD